MKGCQCTAQNSLEIEPVILVIKKGKWFVCMEESDDWVMLNDDQWVSSEQLLLMSGAYEKF